MACGNWTTQPPGGFQVPSLLPGHPSHDRMATSATLGSSSSPNCLPTKAALHAPCHHPGPHHSQLECYGSLLHGLSASSLCSPEPDTVLSLSTQSDRDPAPQGHSPRRPTPGTIIEWKEQGLCSQTVLGSNISSAIC